MSDPPRAPSPPSNGGDPVDEELRRTIMRKSLRRRAAQRGRDNPLAWVATFGVIGWTVVVPTLIGLFIGRALDRRFEGQVSFTITLLVLGAFIGVTSAWQWVAAASRKTSVDRSPVDKEVS